MRITINLATRPFVELKPLYARLRLVMALLALAAVETMFAVWVGRER
jgi:type IV pilus assembly protein PilN